MKADYDWLNPRSLTKCEDNDVTVCFRRPMTWPKIQLVRKGPFKCYVTQMGVGGGVRFSGKKRYEGIMFNVISVTRGWVGVQFAEK